MKKKLKKILTYLLLKNRIGSFFFFQFLKFLLKLKNNELCVISVFNFGENYLFCCLLNAIKGVHKIDCIKFIFFKKKYRGFLDLFTGESRSLVLSDLFYKFRFLKKFNRVQKGGFYFWHNYSISPLKAKKHYLEILKEDLRLPASSTLELPHLKSCHLLEAEHIFNRLHLRKNKTIFLAPQAESWLGLFPDLTNEICEYLIYQGFDVVINSSKDYWEKKYVVTYLPINLIPAFCSLCQYFVAARSGLCDVVSFVDMNILTINPNEDFLVYFSLKPIVKNPLKLFECTLPTKFNLFGILDKFIFSSYHYHGFCHNTSL